MLVLAVSVLALGVSTVLAIWQYPCDVELVTLVGRSLCPSWVMDIDPLLVALGFWATGLVVMYAGYRGPPVGFFLTVAGVLAAGKLSDMGSDPGGRLFYLFLAWLSPLTFHSYHALLEQPLGRVGRGILLALYGLAVVWSIPFLFLTRAILDQQSWFPAWRVGVRFSFALAFGLATLALLRGYHRQTSLAVRRRIRVIAFGTVCAFAPLLLLSLVPNTLRMPAYLPYELTFPFLLLSPLAYAYSVLRPRLLRAEVGLSRAARYFLLITLLLAIYLLAAATSAHFGIGLTSLEAIPIAFFSVVLLLLFEPLRHSLERVTNWVLYGAEINYGEVVPQLTQGLSFALDRDTLERLLIDDLGSEMRLSKSALFLADQNATLILAASTGFPTDGMAATRLPGDGCIATFLKKAAGTVFEEQLRREMENRRLGGEEQALLTLAEVALWVPLVAGGDLQGILLIGPKTEGDYFTHEDEHILTILARQAGIAAANVRLAEQIRAGQHELALAHQQVLVGREQEQRRLAREVHDGAIQDLLSVNFALARWRKQVTSDSARLEALLADLEVTQQHILKVVGQLRSLVGELRPPGLEELGIRASLEAYVVHLRREYPGELPHIYLEIEEMAAPLPEPVAICIFRVAQEAVRNALKHAAATRISLRLHMLSDEAVLSVKDDGQGFRVPNRLSELVRTDRFGLVGLTERVASVGGQLSIQSQPGMGTEVIVRLPLSGGSNRDGNAASDDPLSGS